MTGEEKDKLRERMAEDISSLEDVAGKLRESARPVAPDNAIGRLTRMEAINAKEISEASLTNARERLGKLRAALKRLDQNGEDFGICRECEEPIPEGRIMLLPESIYCVRCAGRR